VNVGLPSGEWLNVGSGPLVVDGWISIDGSWQARLAAHPWASRLVSAVAGRKVGHWPRGIVCHDVRHGLHLEPESAAVIYSSHFIEHLSREAAAAFLRECHRVLKPGGVCRIVTPDLQALVERYRIQSGSGADAADAFVSATLLVQAGGNGVSPWLRWYRAHTQFETHKWLYDAASLTGALCRAGFGSACPRRYLDSLIPSARLAQVELRERIEHGEGIVVEAVK
jgi:SAM-dependent methyltransferase